MIFPFGIYCTRQCGLVHIGMYKDIDDCWNVFSGWAGEDELRALEAAGLIGISVTCTYDPYNPLPRKKLEYA